MKESIQKLLDQSPTFLKPKDYCGVYILYNNDEIVYVGKSKNIHRRIYQHTDKEFTHFKIIEVGEDNYDRLERILIDTYFPFYNLDPLTIKNLNEACSNASLVTNLINGNEYGLNNPNVKSIPSEDLPF